MKLKIEIEGIPNKPQAACLILLALFVIAMVVFLCIEAETVTDLSVRRVHALLMLIPLALLLFLTFVVCSNFPNIDELRRKNDSFMEEFGYHYENLEYLKKQKIIIFSYRRKNSIPICFITYIKEKLTVPFFEDVEGRQLNIWDFLKFIDEDVYEEIKDSKDAFKKCMKLMTDFMESNPNLFLATIERCIVLNFYKYTMPDSRPADYCLGCYYGSCFIDFNKKDGLIYLERISFDGFGCYEISNPEASLTAEESEIFINELEKQDFSQKLICPLVLKLINLNLNSIDADVFEEYPLLKGANLDCSTKQA